MIGKAQEKATVYRTTKRRCAKTGKTYPWLMKSTAMVNHYYFYCVDREFGPFFIKFRSCDPVVLAVLSALLMFRLWTQGFSNRDLRDHVAQLLVCPPDEFTLGRMSYHLRRLRLKGLIARISHTHRYRVTESGLRAALCYVGTHTRVIRPFAHALQRHTGLQQSLLEHLRPLLATAAA